MVKSGSRHLGLQLTDWFNFITIVFLDPENHNADTKIKSILITSRVTSIVTKFDIFLMVVKAGCRHLGFPLTDWFNFSTIVFLDPKNPNADTKIKSLS
jgi:hypothetical protein